MTPEQCQAAREMLGWNEQDLAIRAICTELTVKHFEAGRKRSYRSTVTAIRGALENAGVEFTDRGTPRVHLRRAAAWTPEQCRAGRQMLGWNCQRLGYRAGLTSTAVRRFEKGARCRPDTTRALRAALEAAGVEFTDDPPGLGLRVASASATGSR